MKIKKLMWILLASIIIVILIAICFLGTGIKNKNDSSGKITIAVTTFSAYDFVKQIAGDKVQLIYLLGPGVNEHGYEPSAKDLIDIQNSDIFIYVGGNMEKWIEKVLDTLDTSNTTAICLMDIVDLVEEQEIDGAQEEEDEEEFAYDEHIWSSLENAMVIVRYLADILSQQDTINKELYDENATQYINEIKNVKEQIKEIVDNRVRDRLVFGDKMPMQYFINEFGLEVSALFNGCSTETEPSVSSITYIIDKVKEEDIPIILYIELNNGKVAEIIAEETEKRARQIQTLHNVSKTDFNAGETYVSLMIRNLSVLKEALQ